MSPLDAALALARLGLEVLPVTAGGKIPARSGWQSLATKSPKAVEALFSDGKVNLGVATGARSGAWVLDVDVKNAAGGLDSLDRLVAEHGRLPITWRSRTPSGGLHLWWRYPRRRRVGNRVGVRPGLDVRGDGGFVVAPPSRIAGAAYAWEVEPKLDSLADAPDWLLEIAAPEPELKAGSVPRRGFVTSSAAAMSRYALRALEGELERVETARPGSRNHSLFVASCALGSLVGAGLLPLDLAQMGLAMAAEVSGLVQDDGRRSVAATIASGLKRGLSTPRVVS